MATATSILNLLFTVDGTTESVAKIESFRSSISHAADDLTDRWEGPLANIEGGITRIAARAQTDLTQGLAAAAASVGALTYAFLSLGKAFVTVNEQFASFEISLASSLKSAANARKVVEEIARVSPSTPLEVTDLANVATAISVEPQLRDKLNRQAAANTLNDPNSIFKQMQSVVEELTTLRPDRSTDSAVFAVRQALAGRMQSLERTFNLSPQFLTAAGGTSLTDLKNQGPEGVLNALVNGLAPLISQDAIRQRTEQPSVAINNLSKQLFQLPSIQVGQAGLNDTIINKLQGFLQQSSYFFNKSPGDSNSGAFESKGYASQISAAMTTIINEVTEKLADIADQALSHFGFGADKGSLLDRATQAIIASFNYIADNAPKFIDRVIEVGSKIGSIIESFLVAATKGLNLFLQLTANLGPTGTALAALAAPAIVTKVPALLLNKGLNTLSDGATNIVQSAKSSGIAAVEDAKEAAADAASIAKQAAREAASLSSAATKGTKLVVDEVSPMATAFQVLTKEANNAAASMRGGALRATQDIADALNLAGITAASGKNITAGQFVSQSMLEQGAESAGARFTAKAAADQASKDAAALAATNAAEIAEVNALVAEQQIAKAESEAFAKTLKAGALAAGELILVFAAIALAAYNVEKAFEEFTSMREAQQEVEDSATRAQESFVIEASSAAARLSLIANGKQKDELATGQVQSAHAIDYVNRITDAFSLDKAVPGTGRTDKVQRDIESLIDLLKNDPRLTITQKTSTKFNPLTGDTTTVNGPYTVSNNQGSSATIDLNTNVSELKTILSSFASDISKNANSDVANQLGKDAYAKAQAQLVADKNAIAQGQSSSKIADSIGLGQYRAVADVGSALSTDTLNFTQIQDKLETARGEADKYASLMADYNKAYAEKQQEINDELAKVKAIDVAAVQKSLLEIVRNITEYEAATPNLTKEQKDLADKARLNFATAATNVATDKAKATTTLNAAQGSLPSDLTNRLAAGATIALNQLFPTLKNSQANDPLAHYNFSQFQKQLAENDKNEGTDPTTVGIHTSIIGRASQLGKSLLDIGDQFDSTYEVGIQKYNTELAKASATVDAFSTYQQGLSTTLGTLDKGSKQASIVQSALTAAEKDLATEKSAALKLQREYDNFLKQGSIEQNALNAAVAQQKIDAQKAAGLHVTTADVRNAAANSATSNLKSSPLGSFGAGFASQFKNGDDVNNYADVGIKAAQSVQSAWGTAFTAMVTGSESAGAAFRQMTVSILQDVAKMLAEKAAASLIASIVGSFAGGTAGDGSGDTVQNGGFILRNATGGYIGVGGGAVDDVPALLMRGEYVLNQNAVSRIGRANLDKWNNGQHMKYAEGGTVGEYANTSSASSSPNFTPMMAAMSQVKAGDSTSISVTYNSAPDSSGSSRNDQSGDSNKSNSHESARALKAAIIDTIQEWERKKRIRGN